ncbi:Protein of uncharacterised function (DUF3025) [Moraxella lacunata]|uniref:Protein of uncharacterized function (DUF3025) n=1 Tax=Moraxella lacunata TaxID=477 RepID=A0A378TPK9_MORLA|nr:DUF3025 domain-containing protein [Moraxella lacunata]STZ62795.1 Protein of uncharacterised function (DUF3025) [Moraxella lacunata]
MQVFYDALPPKADYPKFTKYAMLTMILPPVDVIMSDFSHDFLHDFATIDLSTPWLAPYLPIHQAFADRPALPLFEWLNGYFADNDIALKNHQNCPLTFTHQNDLEHGTAYETHIGQHHKIPTRDNLHDWFGACVWSVFPHTKSLLNAKHLAHMGDNHTANARNRVRDTITVFDENGAILVVADDEIGTTIGQALVGFDWQTCLVDNREYWADYHNDNNKKAKVFIFGHALLEQLINPYKSLCSHTVIIKVHSSFFAKSLNEQLAMLDNQLSEHLNNFLKDDITPRQLNPLPILGVPYFWDNADPAFYDDPFVFRKGRRK